MLPVEFTRMYEGKFNFVVDRFTVARSLNSNLEIFYFFVKTFGNQIVRTHFFYSPEDCLEAARFLLRNNMVCDNPLHVEKLIGITLEIE